MRERAAVVVGSDVLGREFLYVCFTFYVFAQSCVCLSVCVCVCACVCSGLAVSAKRHSDVEREVMSVTRRQIDLEQQVCVNAYGHLRASAKRLSVWLTPIRHSTTLQCALLVLRTHYEYAFDLDSSQSSATSKMVDEGNSDSASDDADELVGENLHGLSKLQPHAINFKALRAAARDDEFSPVIALLGPTASGKSAIVREFRPTM